MCIIQINLVSQFARQLTCWVWNCNARKRERRCRLTWLINWSLHWLDWFKDSIIHFLLSLKEISYVMAISKYRSWNFDFKVYISCNRLPSMNQAKSSCQLRIIFQGLLALATWEARADRVHCSWTAVLLQDMKIVYKLALVMWWGDILDYWWWISNNIGWVKCLYFT